MTPPGNSWRPSLLWYCVALAMLAQATLWWRAFHWYPQLPERFPIHFDFRGQPDGWAERGPSFFLLPGLALAMTVFLGGITLGVGALVRNTPGIVNVPRKDLFLKLSPEGRMRVVEPTRIFIAWVLALMGFLFLAILEGSSRVAVKQADTLGMWPLAVFMAGMAVTLPLYWIRTARAVEDAARDEGALPAAERRAGGMAKD